MTVISRIVNHVVTLWTYKSISPRTIQEYCFYLALYFLLEYKLVYKLGYKLGYKNKEWNIKPGDICCIMAKKGFSGTVLQFGTTTSMHGIPSLVQTRLVEWVW